MTPDISLDLMRRTLGRYDEALLRQVAARLVKPRNQWPAEELIARCVDTAANPVVIDRRLQDLAPAAREVLALIGHSRQPRWGLGNLVEMALALGHADGLAPVFDLLEAGLLLPDLGPALATAKVRDFAQWVANPAGAALAVFSPPQVAARAVGTPLSAVSSQQSAVRESQQDAATPLPVAFLTPVSAPLAPGSEADGLEWLLRLGVLWQQAAAVPFRRTLGGGFFKRDAERLGQDPLLNAPPAERLADVPDLGFLLAALAELESILIEGDGELRAGALPVAWEEGLAAALAALWADLFRVQSWDPIVGHRGPEAAGNPFPSAYLLTFLLLAHLPEGAWARPDDVQGWLEGRHPYWNHGSVRPSRRQPWVGAFLLGVAYHLRLVQATRDDAGEFLVRLAPTGRWLLGLGEAPPPPPAFPQTLLVQPNLEVVAYRQGLMPALVARLTRFATWKTLGAACTLQLSPETVYRALEAGETFDSIRQALEQHGTRATPPAVLDTLRTWADKRERLTVFPSATLLEFASAADLNEALARGLPALRVADTLAVLASEEAVDFRHFRLTATRDYALPPEKCVTVEADGVTLTVDLARSDLLLETELGRFAERLERPTADGRRQYRLTPTSLAQAREAGLAAPGLEAWFQQRTGQAPSPAARLLLQGAEAAALRLRRHLVLHVSGADLADGLMQWPQTRPLIEARLGPTALSVAEDNVEALRERLRSAGMELQNGEAI